MENGTQQTQPNGQPNNQPNGQQQEKSPLDQLQFMLNVVLESTGRVFAEANRGADKDRAIAAASKLRSVLPLAHDNFQNALDDLEYELRMARYTLRRDLIAHRKQNAVAAKEINGVEAIKDTEMSDAPSLPQADVPSKDQAGEAAKVNGTADAKPKADLQIDTSTQPPKPVETDTAEPGTGGMSAMDFDSLFNDPDSARGSIFSASPPKDHPPISSAPAGEAAKTETAAPVEAATSTAGAGNDNEDISSLLPGLESYANAAESDMVDLSTPEAKPDVSKKEAQGDGGEKQGQDHQQQQSQTKDQDQQQNQDQSQSQSQNPDQNRDTTFDDLMDFGDFDLNAFGDGTNFEDAGGSTFDDNYFDL